MEVVGLFLLLLPLVTKNVFMTSQIHALITHMVKLLPVIIEAMVVMGGFRKK